MLPRLFVALFLLLFSLSINAQVYEVPDSSAVSGIGKTFEVTSSDFHNVTVVSSNDVLGYVQSLDKQITITVAKPDYETIATTLTIQNLAPETSYTLIKNGTTEKIITNETGAYVCNLDLSMPQKILILPDK